MGEATAPSRPGREGGVPHPDLAGGYPPPSRPGMGYLPPDLGQGTPHPTPTWDGVPPPRWGVNWQTPPWLDGVPPPTMTGWGTPHHDWMGTPSPWLDGVPPQHHHDWMGYPPPIRQSSIASTCYVAGGMPLAFTQEDFLVQNYFDIFLSCPSRHKNQVHQKQ